MAKTRVLLADDHKLILGGLKGLLEQEFELVGTVEDGKALVSEAVRLRPDVVVVDISMTRMHIVTHLSPKYEAVRNSKNGWTIHEAGMAQNG